VRGGELSRDEYRTAKSLAETIATTWQMIGPSAPIAAKACLLLETYPLRAADALQLAAALEWCEGRPNGRVFLTFDRRLSEAASAVGFTLR
jgi:predicted nucleic acid-binding protein